MTPVTESDTYRASFERFAEGQGRADASWLRARRTAAMARFAERGFPTIRDEAWKYTSVAPIARTAFRTADGVRPRSLASGPLASLLFDGLRAVFVNGRFAPELSALDVPRGLEVLSLRETRARNPERLEPHLTRQAGEEGNAFTALNTAFVEDGAVVFLAAGAVAERPIHLVFFSTNPEGAPTVSHPRCLIVAGPASQARVVESYGGPEGEAYFTNAVTEIVVGENASLDHSKLQRESTAAYHVATITARQERASRFSSHAVSLGAALARNDIEVLLGGEGGECELNGLFMADGKQHTDTHTRIDHAKPHCSSRELYKGVMDGRARGVFNGKIVVRKDSQKTDAYQTNKNLLLSGEALVNSTPQLEIFADDVKCKHGSTTGQLDPTALFYLRSRGIGEAAARSLLTYAFASDLVQRIRVEPLRAQVEAHLRSRLPSAMEIKEAVV